MLTGVFTVRCLELSRDPLQMLLHWPASLLLWGALPAVAGILLRAREQAEARTRTEQSRRTASEEQLQMAQELHDAVGHGLSVIAMQAGAGRHVLDHDPDRARQALQAVEETARSSLDALRREIAALGTGGSHVLEPSEAVAAPDAVAGARDSVRLRPQEGVADLPLLVEHVRDGGLLVELDLDAALDPEVLPAEVDHAAYRIVQESLTNVLRHAGTGVTAQVRIRAVTAELLVEVSNTDAGEPDGSAPMVVPGTGLQGMQDRARRVGGRVEVAPHTRGGSRGGFCVTARLPLPALARTERR